MPVDVFKSKKKDQAVVVDTKADTVFISHTKGGFTTDIDSFLDLTETSCKAARWIKEVGDEGEGDG